jgi:uncharacterized membrane protein
MSLYPFLRFLHILSVAVLVGGIFARELVRRSAKQATDVRALAGLIRAARRIDVLMVSPGSMAATLLGIVLALIARVPILGFLQGGTQNWLLVSNILLVGTIAAVPLIFVPWGKRMEPIIEAALGRGEVTTELRAELENQVVRLAHLYEETSMVVVTALMVLKPF